MGSTHEEGWYIIQGESSSTMNVKLLPDVGFSCVTTLVYKYAIHLLRMNTGLRWTWICCEHVLRDGAPWHKTNG